jgi:hypothetical protein
MTYESKIEVASNSAPGVRLLINRMSFGRRLELTRKVQEMAKKLQFLAAGPPETTTEAEQALLGAEIDREYLRWGLAAVEGLEIDGQAAGPEELIEAGPEVLLREALAAVRREAGLSETDRKNEQSHSTSSLGTVPGGTATDAAA